MTEYSSDAFDTFRFMPEATFKLMQSRIEKLNEIESRQSMTKSEPTEGEMQGAGDLPAPPPQFITPGTLSATSVPSSASTEMSHFAYEDPNADAEQGEEHQVQQQSGSKVTVSPAKRPAVDTDQVKKHTVKKEEQREEKVETGEQPHPPYYLGKGPFSWTV